MSWLTMMSNERLADTIVRLRADLVRIEQQMAAVAAALDRDGEAPEEDPVYRRLEGIRQDLSLQLAQARDEASLRRASRSAPRSRGFWRCMLAPMRHLFAFTTGDER